MRVDSAACVEVMFAIARAVAVASGVRVGVMVGVGVGVTVNVAVKVGVGVGCGVFVGAFAVSCAFCVACSAVTEASACAAVVSCTTAVNVRLSVAVAVGVNVNVGVKVGVGVAVYASEVEKAIAVCVSTISAIMPAIAWVSSSVAVTVGKAVRVSCSTVLVSNCAATVWRFGVGACPLCPCVAMNEAISPITTVATMAAPNTNMRD